MNRAMRPRQFLVGVLVAFVAMLVAPAAASAHSDIDYTLPTEGASVGEPLTEVTVAFTQQVTLVGPGFEVLSPQGEIFVPFVVTDDDQVFRLQIDPPMGGGDVGVRYEVTAQDGHVIAGGFSFTVSVEAPAPTTTSAPVPTTAAPAPTTAAPTPTTASPTPTTVAPPATTESAVDEEAVDVEPVDAATPELISADDDDDGNSNAVGIFIAIVVAGVVGGVAFIWFRNRSSA